MSFHSLAVLSNQFFAMKRQSLLSVLVACTWICFPCFELELRQLHVLTVTAAHKFPAAITGDWYIERS